MYIILGILLIILFCLIGSKEGFKAKRPWIKCADEGGLCKAPRGAFIRYGANGRYKGRGGGMNHGRAVECSNAMFGDPIRGVRKVCEYSTEVPTEGGWRKCAFEGQINDHAFPTANPRNTVKYGAGSSWVSKSLASKSLRCRNSTFGDPLVGIGKECYCKTAPPPPKPKPKPKAPPPPKPKPKPVMQWQRAAPKKPPPPPPAAPVPILGCKRARHYGQHCFECNDGYSLSGDKKICTKIPKIPINDCARQEEWGRKCLQCHPGYRIEDGGAKCQLVPIGNCKKQKNEYCEECEVGFKQGKEGKTCEKIPKIPIKNCEKQREWGEFCNTCNKYYKPTWNNKKCQPLSIKNCAIQKETICDECEPGYDTLKDKYNCELITIKDCNVQDGPICKECKLGYRLSKDRRLCELKPIPNCSKRN